MKKVNVHIHTLNYEYTPEGYLGKKLPFNMAFLKAMEGSLWLISWLYKRETMLNYKRFVDVFDSNNMIEVLKKLRKDEDSVQVALAMDMKSIDGKCDKDIYEQIEEFGKMKLLFKDFYWFVAIDPTRPEAEIKALLKHALVNRASGYKCYPSLGYLPTHPNLMNIIYPFCIEHKWPITTHCSSAITHASSKRILVEGLDEQGNDINEYWKFRKENDYLVFNNPKQWIPVFNKYPELVVNFAHAGGSNKEWRSTIQDFMCKHKGVFADLSYTFTNHKVLAEILEDCKRNDILKSKYLYGTDYWMVLIEGEYKELVRKFDNVLKESGMFEEIAMINPLKFMNYAT